MGFEERLKKSTDAFNKGDIDSYLTLFTDDAVLYDPLSPEPSRGKEAIRRSVAELLKMFPDASIKILRLVVGDGVAAGEIMNEGTNTGPLKTPAGVIPATNRHLKFQGAFFASLDSEGLILEGRRYWDTMSFMKQLGLGPC